MERIFFPEYQRDKIEVCHVLVVVVVGFFFWGGRSILQGGTRTIYDKIVGVLLRRGEKQASN